MTLEAGLSRGLDALNLALEPEVSKKLLDYLALIQKWNRVYNLTAVRDPERMLTYHVLDSLAVAPHIAGKYIIDVGSGSGLPGIPLALALPGSSVTLLESNNKKSTFLKQAVIELALANVDVVHARVEAWNVPQAFDVVISRAFSDLAEFVALAGRHCAAEGVLAAMKGVYPYEEINQLAHDFRLDRVIPLHVPTLDAERHLVVLRRA